MPTRPHILAIAAATVLLLGGCCRDSLREMVSIKDLAPERGAQARTVQKSAPQKQAVAKPEQTSEQSVADTPAAPEGEAQIETGSVERPENCQGAHVAYQATREYLKNFGPRPADQPGEKGACMPDAR